MSLRHVVFRVCFCGYLSLFSAFLFSTAGANSTRQITFKLSFANQDLLWYGDPASPTSTVYLKPGVQPVATDVCVTTQTTQVSKSTRRYYRECRIVKQNNQLQVLGFTSKKEKLIGTINSKGQFVPNQYYADNKDLLPSWPTDVSILSYDTEENALYQQVKLPGPTVTESLDFLPLNLQTPDHQPAQGTFSIDYQPTTDEKSSAKLNLLFNELIIATATLPTHFIQSELKLNSYDKQATTYFNDAAYRPGSDNTTQPCVTIALKGQFTAEIDNSQDNLVLKKNSPAKQTKNSTIVIDGNFDDWRNITGVDDPRGDLVPYLDYVPDVDILEFKVAHDNDHIYLYARVVGQVGRSHPSGGRNYFYAYMDIDQDAKTGFLPSRDDDCYFGVDIGDDCEVQFEFVDNVFRKTFYGFCGLGGNDNVLKQQVTLGRSQYGRFDTQGNERANYKAEYIYRDGRTEITEDLKLGTSDTIHLSVSPDGSEVEVVSKFSGFLKNPQGQSTLGPGQTIDIALGMESDSKAYLNKTQWGADSTQPIRGYQITRISE